MTIKAIIVGKWVEQAGIDFSPAFVHGVLTAYACQDENNNYWATLLQPQSTLNSKQKQAFKELATAQKDIARQLADSELSFQLPCRDEATIRQQSLSTRDWASGLWLGLQHNDLLSQIEDEASAEFVGDLQRIAAMPLPDAADKENSADLLEIQEYCRMGAIGLFLSVRSQHTE